MKTIHLLCHCDGYQSMDFPQFSQYAMLESDKTIPSSKWQEEDDLLILVDELKKAGLSDFDDFDDFYFGYIIEHISKEFDLLRIGHNFSLNIELKHQASQDKVLKQLLLNQYYLKSVFDHVHYFSYVISTGTLYCLSDQKLVITEMSELVRLIKLQSVQKNIDIDSLFEPSQYLVSPLNQTGDFLSDRYFLTNQQQDFKNKICEQLTIEKHRIGLEGMAGTGKTLLLYDIAKTLMKSQSLAILHCGLLSPGHHALQKAGFDIYDMNDDVPLKNYQVLCIDEAQRLSPMQLSKITETHLSIIYAYDDYDLLFHHPLTFPVEMVYKLSNHIRINPTVMQFISHLFDAKTKNVAHFKDQIEIRYFQDKQIAYQWLYYSKDNGYVLLDDSLPHAKISSEIVGLDFEQVVILLDERFIIEQGRLVAKNDKELALLYLRLTRARKKIRIAILNNLPLLQYCIDILQNE